MDVQYISKDSMHKNYGANQKKRQVSTLGSVLQKQQGTSF